MAQYVDTNTKTLVAGAAIAEHIRVKFSSGKVIAAGANDLWIGTTTREAFADGDAVTVRLRTAQGTSKYVGGSAITTGSIVYAAASGKVNDVVTGEAIGVALPLNSESSTTACGADGDVMEVLHLPLANTSGYVITAAQDALSGAGAIPVTTYYTAWTTTGANAGTLADGTVIGQLKKIKQIVDGGDGTLTPANLAGGTTITFADAGDYAVLKWDGAEWYAVELGNDADGATAPVLA